VDRYAGGGKGKVIIAEDSEAFARMGAELFLQRAVSAVKQSGRFSVALSGSNKAPLLKALLENPQNDYPANLVRPESGELIWLVDQDAASKLTG